MASPPASNMSETAPLELLGLPDEILSHIASFLPLPDLISFLSLNLALHNLTHSHLTPLRPVIRDILRDGIPYPPELEVLPSLTHLVDTDDGRLFQEVLVRAPARWILERFEIGRWRDSIWKDAFERRFLPSWRRYKQPDDTWRAVFLRVLGRLDHRSVGCAHHESWTRFIHLRRNGSGSLNRIYTRTFDPYEIMDELKHQGGVAEYPTVVRVLVHLQDVRILAIGVVADKPSYYVNPNAHLVLHPPLLRSVQPRTRRRKLKNPSVADQGTPALPPPRANSVLFAEPLSAPAVPPAPPPTAPQSALDNFLPLTRTMSSGSGSDGGSRRGSMFLSLRWIGRRRSDADAEASTSYAPLTRTRSNDRRASWGFIGRARTNSTAGLQASQLAPPLSPLSPPLSLAPATTPSAPPAPSLPTLPEDKDDPETPETLDTASLPTPAPSPTPLRGRYPYRPLERPTPVYTHAQYPNHTPAAGTDEGLPWRRVGDFRPQYQEVEEDVHERIWSGNEGVWGSEGQQMAEIDPYTGERQRWVGPMIIVAQLFSGTRTDAWPPGGDGDGGIEGPTPDLGPRGMYASLGWEDFDVLLPWIELRGGGAYHDARRVGLGFETTDEA